MRIRRQATTGVRHLLTEAVHLRLGEPTFEEGAGVDAGRGVTLEEDLVPAPGVVRSAEEVVEADFEQGCG